jgi:uncharacterized protein (DUF2147 family)
MKIRFWPVLVFFTLILPVQSVFAQNTGVPGYWKTVDDKTGKVMSIVKIWEQQGKLIGRVVKLFRAPNEDQNPKCDDCTGSLYNKPVIGMTFLWGFVRDHGNDRKWVDGSIVDPDNGKQYRCQLELTDGGKKLEVFGYIRLVVKIGRTQVWLRASERDLGR